MHILKENQTPTDETIIRSNSCQTQVQVSQIITQKILRRRYKKTKRENKKSRLPRKMIVRAGEQANLSQQPTSGMLNRGFGSPTIRDFLFLSLLFYLQELLIL